MKSKYYFNIFFISFISGIIFIFILGDFYKKNIDQDTAKFYYFPSSKLKVINLGTSHGVHAFNYNKYENCYNLALYSQPLYYDLEILKKYKNNLEENCIIILPISLFSFYQGYKFDFGNLNDRYYDILNYKQVYNHNYRDLILNRYFPLARSGKRLVDIGVELIISIYKNKTFPKLINSRKQLKDLKVFEEYNLTTSNRHQGVGEDGWNEEVKIGIKKLIEILDYVEENNWIPILVSTPQSYLYNEATKNKYDERIYINLKKVFEIRKKKTIYLDYSNDSRFQKDLNYFLDSDHLDEKGSMYFTDIIFNDLKINLKN